MSATKIYVVQHVAREGTPEECVKFIGVFSSQISAEEAVKVLSDKPGFRDFKESFHIGVHEVDNVNWTQGFDTISC